ncbi:MAG: hypothetical protein KDK91_16085, partial [Gammaproteobacteria bacterium]|nr:hypothetical protein [Gammaproteobacteria bacterium]
MRFVLRSGVLVLLFGFSLWNGLPLLERLTQRIGADAPDSAGGPGGVSDAREPVTGRLVQELS